MQNVRSITDSAAYRKIPDVLNASPHEAALAGYTEIAPGTVSNLDEEKQKLHLEIMRVDAVTRADLTSFSKKILVYSIGFTSVLTIVNMTFTALRIPCLDSAQFIAANVTSISYNLLLVAFKYYFKDKNS